MPNEKSRIAIVSKGKSEYVELLDLVLGKEKVNGRLILCNGKTVEHMNEKKALELKKKLETLKSELSSVGINPGSKNNKIKILMYLYGKLQKEIKYSNPSIMLKEWNPMPDRMTGEFENVINSYGALVDNYALCAGISEGMALACQYFGIECKVLDLENVGVKHRTNLATINEKPIHFDLSAEIGMGEDGRYIEKGRKRLVPKEKNGITYKYFGRTKSEITSNYCKFEDVNVPEGIKIPQDLSEMFEKRFYAGNRNRINYRFENINVPKEFKESQIFFR